jgi:hypothetical protein
MRCHDTLDARATLPKDFVAGRERDKFEKYGQLATARPAQLVTFGITPDGIISDQGWAFLQDSDAESRACPAFPRPSEVIADVVAQTAVRLAGEMCRSHSLGLERAADRDARPRQRRSRMLTRGAVASSSRFASSPSLPSADRRVAGASTRPPSILSSSESNLPHQVSSLISPAFSQLSLHAPSTSPSSARLMGSANALHGDHGFLADPQQQDSSAASHTASTSPSAPVRASALVQCSDDLF